MYPSVGLAAVLCLWSFVQYYTAKTEMNRATPDPYRIGAQLIRYEGLPPAVPPDAVIGYLSDLPVEDSRSTVLFLGAQYALAPRILVDDDRRAWVLGNFAAPADFGALGAAHHLTMVRDFGNGVVLYRRADR
jgi:hypothetical protein